MPRMIFFLMAFMLMAWLKAWRTLLSLKGFLPFKAGLDSESGGLVEAQEHGAKLGADQHRGALVAVDALDVLHRHRVHHVDFAGKQRGNPGGVGGDGG